MRPTEECIRKLFEKSKFPQPPFYAFHDQEQLGGAYWRSLVGIFCTVGSGPRFKNWSHAQKCSNVSELLQHSAYMEEVYHAYWRFREIALANDEKASLPAGPMFLFLDEVDPLAWASPPAISKRYPVVPFEYSEVYHPLGGPWYEFGNSTDPRTWEASPWELIQYPLIKMPGADKMASVGIACHSNAGVLFQYASRKKFEKAVRVYSDRLTHPRSVQETWIDTPPNDLEPGILSRHILHGRRIKATVNDIEVGFLHHLVVEELLHVINVWIMTEVIPADRFDSRFSSYWA